MRIVTLTTDFGTGDYACGILHGVVWTISPGAEVVDLSHAIPRHDVLAGALLLKRSLPHFPPGTVHVSVVDPGVGTARRPIAARLGDQFFVGPDNGLVSLAARACEKENQPVRYVHLDRPTYWLQDVSAIFHGRDIFTPAAAHLANGVDLEELGSEIHDPVELNVPEPVEIPGGYSAQVIHIDHFGNLSTNLPANILVDEKNALVTVGSTQIEGISTTFGDRIPGEFVALIDSSGFLSICLVNESAEKALGINVGSSVNVSWSNHVETGKKNQSS